jgi:hypothetical protein
MNHPKRRISLPRWAAYAAALVALLTVFSLYLQPEFMVSLADQFWACF